MTDTEFIRAIKREGADNREQANSITLELKKINQAITKLLRDLN